MQELTVEARVENLDKVNDFINQAISGVDCSKKAVMQLGVVVEEIFVNIASYSYPETVGFATVQVEVKNNAVDLTFIDNGIKYNPLDKDDPDVELAAEERDIGGLGIYLVKSMVEEISYNYVDNKNILSLTKKLN